MAGLGDEVAGRVGRKRWRHSGAVGDFGRVGDADIVPVRALLLGERLDTRALERGASVGIAPLTLDIPSGGVVVLFRYGAVVLFGPPNAAMDEFVATLMPSIAGAFPATGAGGGTAADPR